MKRELDQKYMQEALALAQSVAYITTPNPRVGCVIVKDGQVIGRGATQKAGKAHAEVMALLDVRDRFGNEATGLLQGSIVYVTLEPCAHQGRTAPCVDALREANVGRVVVAMQDPNPLVAGKGLALLREAGVEVECGLCADEALDINKGFVSRMIRQRPWIRTKLALSLDGFMCRPDGKSQWITGTDARADGHHWRAQSCAIVTGAGTLLQDKEARLTVREVNTDRTPDRIVLDSKGEVSYSHPFFSEKKAYSLRAKAGYTGQHSMFINQNALEYSLALDEGTGHMDMSALLEFFKNQSYNEILIEAGPQLNSALMNAGLIDEMIVYYAPKVLAQGRSPFEGVRDHELSVEGAFSCVDTKMLGRDVRHRLVRDEALRALQQSLKRQE
ncbi:MAG: bifunctional diaminohydroxyphosphoribosylaminopyrimidine deaminase/5-amino-6-(5-phosphoribosylamino)uracil reductase RibD [Alcaligenaceae bacterium]|nr:bifunctional diaminohydroxyphosphoribosylaminopyrimidine deaminase/5-amino-6-(5-phosphoribosylamino)uracil reductase RibD [Alcaligenaceae bacterium]